MKQRPVTSVKHLHLVRVLVQLNSVDAPLMYDHV